MKRLSTWALVSAVVLGSFGALAFATPSSSKQAAAKCDGCVTCVCDSCEACGGGVCVCDVCDCPTCDCGG